MRGQLTGRGRGARVDADSDLPRRLNIICEHGLSDWIVSVVGFPGYMSHGKTLFAALRYFEKSSPSITPA
jgi:hypothetical protein